MYLLLQELGVTSLKLAMMYIKVMLLPSDNIWPESDNLQTTKQMSDKLTVIILK